MVPGHDKNVREQLEHDDKIVLGQIDRRNVMVPGHYKNAMEQIGKNDVQVHDSFVADDKQEQLK